MTPAKPNRSGYTLMELLIVVGIVAVLAAIAIPASRATEGAALEAKARVLAADLRLARSLSIQYGTEFTVRFDTSDDSYELLHTGAGDAPMPRDPNKPLGAQDGTYVVSINGREDSRLEHRVRLAGAALAESGSTVGDVTFGPDGGTGPSRTQDTVIWLTSGPAEDMRSVQLTVSWVTGVVFVERIETGTSPAA